MVNETLKRIEKYKVAETENSSLILEYLNQADITFFSWKMFKYWFENDELKFDFNFDSREADKYIEKEKYLIDTLGKLDLNYKYIKLVPDELIYYFFNIDVSDEAKEFRKQVEDYFRNYCDKTNVLLFSDLVKKDKNYYEEIFNKVMNIKIEKNKFNKEKRIRFNSDELAQKAFALFAAEANLIMKDIPNAVLIAGERSVDTYKYEFYKDRNRSVLPKLFII